MSLLQKINTGISCVLLIACASTFLVFGWSGSGWKALIVPTGSMRPDMPPGSLALVHRVPVSSLKVGDIITYVNPVHPNTTLSHRIVKKYLVDHTIPGFVTKGDANKFSDIPIVGGAVEGRVVWHVPSAGWWLLDLKKPIVILPIIYAAALLIFIEETQRLTSYYKHLLPYRARGYVPSGLPKRSLYKPSAAVGLSIVSLFIFSYFGPAAAAQLKSNTVTLTDNKITVAAVAPPTCSGNTSNNTSISATNTNTQNASSGNAHSSGGSATSGSASNNSSSNINITVTNC
jgi:signal peptidase I